MNTAKSLTLYLKKGKLHNHHKFVCSTNLENPITLQKKDSTPNLKATLEPLILEMAICRKCWHKSCRKPLLPL
ncbi:MAG: hypothetical protein ACFB2X_07560 [Rivularia sp. (in: cyanobacteria)]